ncbi:hypothetical protein [Halococcus saccharolyticus]|uniref:hypothetical protein n=1 Tax=Halococcus saccharolyticus TaxID=62319 RepID=UPI001375D2EB|nr:hypothetical protein [Halococcus saccharolyticus]
MSERLDIIKGTNSWKQEGGYSIGNLSDKQMDIVKPYRITPVIGGTGAEVVDEE